MINNKNTTKTMANQFEEPKPPQPQPHPLLEMLHPNDDKGMALPHEEHPPQPNGLQLAKLQPQFILIPPSSTYYS